MKSDIQSSEGEFQIQWGSTKECDNPIKLWNRAIFPSRWSTKNVLNKLSNFELKISCAVSWKAIFSLVKNFFNWNEGLCSCSVTFPVGSEAEIFFDLGGLRKK